MALQRPFVDALARGRPETDTDQNDRTIARSHALLLGAGHVAHDIETLARAGPHRANSEDWSRGDGRRSNVPGERQQSARSTKPPCGSSHRVAYACERGRTVIDTAKGILARNLTCRSVEGSGSP